MPYDYCLFCFCLFFFIILCILPSYCFLYFILILCYIFNVKEWLTASNQSIRLYMYIIYIYIYKYLKPKSNLLVFKDFYCYLNVKMYYLWKILIFFCIIEYVLFIFVLIWNNNILYYKYIYYLNFMNISFYFYYTSYWWTQKWENNDKVELLCIKHELR